MLLVIYKNHNNMTTNMVL